MPFNQQLVLTSVPSSPARGFEGPGVVISSGLARWLTLVHRVEHHIFTGERMPPLAAWAKSAVERTLGDRQFAEPGMTLRRHAPIARSSLDGVVMFHGAETALVEAFTTSTVDLPAGATLRHRLVIRWDDPLIAGDSITVGATTLVVEAIEPDDASWVRAPGLGQWEGTVSRVTPTCAQRLVARGIGPYSPVTQRPQTPAVTVATSQLRYLMNRGCLSTVGEVASVRSESPVLRTHAYEALVKRKPIANSMALLQPRRSTAFRDDLPDVPQLAEPAEHWLAERLPTLHAAVAEAFVCGFELSQLLPRLTWQLARIGDASDWSRGAVTSPLTYNASGVALPGGLFCPRIFGPTKDFECGCGALKGADLGRRTCEACGVELTRSLVRRCRFGHIELSCLVVPVPFVELVCALLELTPAALHEQLCADGGHAVQLRLMAVDVAQRAAGLPAEHLLSRFAATGFEPADLLWNVVPVLPPDLRPANTRDGHDLNQLYQAVLNGERRLRRLLEQGADPTQARSALIRAVHALLDNERLDQVVTSADDVPLKSVRSLLNSHLQPPPERRVDFAAALVAVVDSTLTGTTVIANEDALVELLRPRLYGLLEEQGVVKTIKQAKAIVENDPQRRHALTAALAPSLPWLVMHAEAAVSPTVAGVSMHVGTEPTLRLSPELAQRLSAKTGQLLTVHLPSGDEALAEAWWLVRFGGDPSRFRTHREAPSSLIAQFGRTTDWAPLVDAALRAASDDGSSLESGLLVGGFDLHESPRPDEAKRWA